MDLAERRAVNKPAKSFPQPLAAIAHKALADSFKRQGFASSELVVRWREIAGPEIAAHCEPIKLQWPRSADPDRPEPATLVLRVEGPAAVEIQHLSGVICERVNRFLGWRAVEALALRQAPLAGRRPKPALRPIDPEAARREATTLGAIADDDLREALARLGAAIKGT